MAGLLALGDRLAALAGLDRLWHGPDGLRAVTEQKLAEVGVPKGPIPLTAPGANVTPRSIAEQAGFIKRPKKRRAHVPIGPR